MNRSAIFVFWLAMFVPTFASDKRTVLSLVGREFRIEDHWTGQEVAFRMKGREIVAVWRILGSGRPVLSETECSVEVKSPRQCVFFLQRDGKRYEVKLAFSDDGPVRAYLDGIRIYLVEKEPN